MILGFVDEVKPKAGLGFRASAAFPDSKRTTGALPVETVQPITTWTRNPVLFAGFNFVEVGLEAAALEASERLAVVRERESSPVECNAADPSGTV